MSFTFLDIQLRDANLEILCVSISRLPCLPHHVKLNVRVRNVCFRSFSSGHDSVMLPFFSVASYIINTEVSCKNGKRDKSPWRQITLDRRVMSRYTFLFMLCDYRCYPSITTLCVKYRSPQEKKDQQ